MLEKDIQNIRDLQNLTGGISDFSLQQIQLLMLANFDEANRVEVEISEEEVNIFLTKYTGIKGWWKKIVNKKRLMNDTLLSKCLLYWLPKNKVIKIQWKN